MTDETLVQQVAKFAGQVTFLALPQTVVDSVKDRVLDTLGICLASSSQHLADGLLQMLTAWGGAPESGVIGGGRYPAPAAALVNGTLAHSLDFDDTHLPSVLHPSASVIPAVLAVSESVKATGADVIAAAAVGLEITIHTGMGGYVEGKGNVFFERGWHATSICGTLGCAAAAGKLLGLDAEGIAHAMGIAASMGSGLLEANRAGGTVKRLHCGWAAHAGISAALMAKHGYTGPPTALEGRFGFYQAFLDGQYDAKAVVEGLGKRWETPGVFFKPYPANHYTHAGIDAVLALKRKHDIDPAAVSSIELGSAEAMLRTIGEPRAEKIRPLSGYHAQFSGPFTVATALIGGGGLGVYFDDFSDARARDERILNLAAKVGTFVDPACDALFPNQFAAVVRIHMQDGRVLEERVMSNRGGPGNPLTPAELRQKFELNARQLLNREQTGELANAIADLDHLPGLEDLLSLTVAKR